MGLEGAGEGAHESGGSSGVSEGRDSGDRGNDRSWESLTSASDTDYGPTWGGFFRESDSRLTEQTKARTIALIKEVGISKVSAPLGGKIVESNKGLLGGLVGAITGAFKGPTGIISGSISGYQAGSKDKSYSVKDLDSEGSTPSEGHEAPDFFNHNLSKAVSTEQDNSIAIHIQGEVIPDPYINFNSLGYSGDASAISPGSNLAVTDQDNSGILAIAAAAAIILL